MVTAAKGGQPTDELNEKTIATTEQDTNEEKEIRIKLKK